MLYYTTLCYTILQWPGVGEAGPARAEVRGGVGAPACAEPVADGGGPIRARLRGGGGLPRYRSRYRNRYRYRYRYRYIYIERER